MKAPGCYGVLQNFVNAFLDSLVVIKCRQQSAVNLNNISKDIFEILKSYYSRFGDKTKIIFLYIIKKGLNLKSHLALVTRMVE